MSTQNPASLAARVEALTGADREVDAEICIALGVMPEVTEWPPTLSDGWLWRLGKPAPYGAMDYRGKVACLVYHPQKEPEPVSLYVRKAPPLTSSLDAALALTERVRPDVYVKIDQYMNTGAVKYAWAKWRVWLKTYEPLGEWFGGPSPTPALALLAALLHSTDTPS
jgi:hypothetical protein